jgi:hypothetical protein
MMLTTVGVGLFVNPAAAIPKTGRANGSAEFQAGFVDFAPAHGISSVSTTFVVPTITCAIANAGQSFGVWGFDSQTAFVAEAAVQTYCSGSNPVYNFYILANSSHFTENGVGPGDKVVASYFQTPGWTQATVHDLTSGVTWIANWATADLPAVRLDIGVDIGPGNGYIAPFGSVPFTKTQINGDYLIYSGAPEYNWVSLPHRTLVSASPITSGDSFKLVFHHSS